MKRALLAAVAVSILVLGTWATIFWLRLPSRMPTDDDYRQANLLIQKSVRPGDVIVLAPAWAERGRQFLTSAPAMQGYDLARDEYPGTFRQWLVALYDVPRFSYRDARAMLLARGKSEGGRRVGNLWVELFDVAGPKVDYSFLDHVAGATVTLDGPRIETCRTTFDGRHQCSRGDWNYVGAGWHEVDYRPFHCIWAHPVNGATLDIRYPEVPLGSKTLRGRGAFTDSAPLLENGAPVFLTVKVGATKVASVRFANVAGLQPFEATLPPNLAATGPVSFEVSTPNNGVRHFCFDAWLGP